MAVSFHLKELRLSEGTIIEPPLDGMTVFTGPNNSGKSALLRELVTAIHHHPYDSGQEAHWVNSVQIHQSGDGEDLLAWLKERGREPRFDRSSGRSVIPGPSDHDQSGMDTDEFLSTWASGSVSSISYLLVNDQWTEGRLGNQTDSHVWNQSCPPSHPSQLLWDDKEAHLKFSNLFERAFGQPITINRYTPRFTYRSAPRGWKTPPHRPGRNSERPTRHCRFYSSRGRNARIHKHPTAYIGSPCPIIVIDEPEAFLHPPQARLLGRYLALHTPRLAKFS